MVVSLRDDGRGILALRASKALRGFVEQGSNPELLTSKKMKRAPEGPFRFLAGGEGFEPPLTESESVVLPLDDPPRQGTSIGALC